MRTFLFGAALALSAPAFACPMADAAAYAEAADKVQAMAGTKLTIAVEGMHCGDCSEKVTAKLSGIDGVLGAAANYQTGETVVAVDAKVDQKALLSAIEELGYKASIQS